MRFIRLYVCCFCATIEDEDELILMVKFPPSNTAPLISPAAVGVGLSSVVVSIRECVSVSAIEL